MTATESIGGQPVDSANFYQFNPYIDELTYDQAMYSNLVRRRVPEHHRDAHRHLPQRLGRPDRPTGPSTSTDLNTFVSQSKIDQRPFRGDWCNQNNAGLGPSRRPTPTPRSPTSTPTYGSSHRVSPTATTPAAPTPTVTRTATRTAPTPTATANTYPTNAIPGFDIPAGQWFPAQFQKLVQNAFPAVP